MDLIKSMRCQKDLFGGLTVVVFTHLHQQNVPFSRGYLVDHMEGSGIASAITEDHSIPCMDRTSLGRAFEDTDILGTGGKKTPINATICG